MDVPFISSGALSRAHYALVRKTETAPSPQAADQLLFAEVESIRSQLARSTLTLKQCKECLIILLYCSMNVDISLELDMDFALHHAVSLAEAGHTIQDKRVGYLFCAEMMQASHELQLMLVNTVRKDLESPETPRICLALDALIQFSTEDVIPAIQPRLVDLLSHSSAHIRRRALLAFHRLSQHNSEILGNIVNKTQKRLMDSDSMVVNAALTVGASLVNARYLAAEEFHATVSRLLHLSWKSYSENVAKWNLIKIMKSLRSVTPSMEELQTILTIAHKSSRHSPSTYAILYQCFVIASTVSSEILLRAQVESNIVLVQEIRHLLTSENVNDIYVFVSCLECIESKLWSGATADVPAVLEEWEVERVMRLLDSSDNFIRRKTLRILEGVDHGIVETYYSQLLRGDSASASLQGSEDASKRLLEVTEVICGEDGEMYAQHVKNMLHTVEGAGPLDKRPVLQEAVEEVLRRVQNGSTTFRSGCIGVSFAHVVEPDIQIGPTLMVIVSALVTEYLHMAPMSPDNLLHGLSTRLLSYAASIQDACLLSMMRVAAECDDVPASVIEVVRNLHDCSGRYIKRRCDQFINLCLRKGALKVIVSSAKSSSLPDLLSALEKYEAEKVNVVAPHSPPLKPVHSASRNSHSPNKLRYEAYEPPKLSSRLRRLSTSSSRASDDGSSKFVGQMRITQDAPSRTLSPGDLTLVAGRSDLVTLSSGSQRTRDVPLPAVHIEDDSATRVDLIALDSPFVTAPTALISDAFNVVEPDFEGIWNDLETYNSRGWCEMSIDAVVRLLQGMQRRLQVTPADQAPFVGELKILISVAPDSGNDGGYAVLRLKESDDEGCLWRLRCASEELRIAIKRVLSEA